MPETTVRRVPVVCDGCGADLVETKVVDGDERETTWDCQACGTVVHHARERRVGFGALACGPDGCKTVKGRMWAPA